jgi:hypothetical protein
MVSGPPPETNVATGGDYAPALARFREHSAPDARRAAGTGLAVPGRMRVPGDPMRVLGAAMLLVVVCATSAAAQDRSAPPESATAVQDDLRPAPGRIADKKFWILAGALNTAMILDTKSTFDVSRVCPDCGEANPIVRPFVERGPAVTYAAGVLFDAGVMTMAARMKGSEHRWMRRTWWVVPVALVVGHTVAYRHNATLFR